MVVDASRDRCARLYAVQGPTEAGEVIATLPGNAGGASALAFDRGGARLATGASAAACACGTRRRSSRGRRFSAPTTARSPRPCTRLTGGSSSRPAPTAARIWDVRRRRLVHVLPTPASDARFSPDGTLVATSSRDGSVRIWRVRDGALVRTLGRGPPLAVVRFSPDGSLVAAVARNGTVRLWRVADGGGQPVLHAPPRVRAVEVAPDGDTLATASTQGAELWSVDGRLLHVLRRHGPRSTVADLVFSPDGKRLLTTSTDTDGRIWSVATDRPLVLLRGQYGVARRRERSARRPLGRDGRRDERRHLARPDGPAPLLRGHERQLTAVSFSPSGGQLLTASADGTVRTYDCRLCSGLAGLERLAEAGLARSGIAR